MDASKRRHSAEYSDAKNFSLSRAEQKQIYAEFLKKHNEIENKYEEAQAGKTSAQLREEGQRGRNKVKSQVNNLKITLLRKWREKYEDMPANYVKKVIDKGIMGKL